MKKFLILLFLIITAIILIHPLFISVTQTVSSSLQISFTIIGGLSSFVTLIIALLLYQRFGIDTKFMERKTDVVLKLVDFLKEVKINIKSGKGTFFFKFREIDIEREKKEVDIYNELYCKNVAFKQKDYEEFIKPLMEIYNSYWIPESIKIKLYYLVSFHAYNELEDFEGKIARFNFHQNDSGEWLVGLPEMTVETFQQNSNKLINEINRWLKKKSNIKIDVKLDESVKY